MSPPLSVSVAMGTYNGARFIRAQLDSLARQTLQPLELVIRDDGSSDATLAIVREFAAEAPFAVAIHEGGRLGFGDNFLAAARLCSGELIAFCDQDDVWFESKLEECVAAFADGVQLVIHASRVASQSLEPTPKLYPAIHGRYRTRPDRFDPWMSIPGFGMVLRAGLLELLEPSNRPPSKAEGIMMSHDEWVYFLAAVCGEVVLIPCVLALYRQHDTNLFGFHSGAAAVPAISRRLIDVTRRARRPSPAVERYALLGREYAAFLEAAGKTRQSTAPCFGVGASFYRRAGHDAALRAQLHAPGTPIGRRVPVFTRLLARRAYRRRRHGGFGRPSLFRDALIAATGAVR